MDRQDILFQQTGVAGALLLEKALLYSVARVVLYLGRLQAETLLTPLYRFPEPALSMVVGDWQAEIGQMSFRADSSSFR